MRIGYGFDVHRLVEGRELWIGGVKIDHDKGLLGHSDADVAIHALCDALLGAAALRDIGYHCPDSDPHYKGIDSRRLLREVIIPWKQGQTPVFQRYDFHHDCLLPPETPSQDHHVLILEGSYCNLPCIRPYADLRLFMTTSEETRLERLRRRESPASLQLFYDRWIPLENAYFAAYGLPDDGCILI